MRPREAGSGVVEGACIELDHLEAATAVVRVAARAFFVPKGMETRAGIDLILDAFVAGQATLDHDARAQSMALGALGKGVQVSVCLGQRPRTHEASALGLGRRWQGATR